VKTTLALLCLVLFAACGSDDGDATAIEWGSVVPAPYLPAATGPVHTDGLVTVMDTGTPEVCLGPVAESYPPQCSGPELLGWDWADHRQLFEHQGDVRWGQFALTGTWDGERLTVESAVPAASYDAAPPPSLAVPVPAVKHSTAELAEIADDVASIPGAQGSGDVRGHNVVVSVVYDDGSLQDWADTTYGDGVVLVHSMLVS